MGQVGGGCWQENKGWSIISKLSREEKREKLEGKKLKELEIFTRLQKRCTEKK